MSYEEQVSYDVIIIGAGAAGLMTAITSAQRGRKTLLIEHSDKIGEKIRISGGGRCNFTNLHASSAQYLSQNPHFMKSALAQYTQHDFIKLIESHHITYHEKTLGQLFCDGTSKQIIQMFLNLCEQYHVKIVKNCSVKEIRKNSCFSLATSQGHFLSESLVIATGGLSIPQIGASPFGYEIAQQFGLNIIPTRPALVPLLIPQETLSFFKELSGTSNYSNVSYKKTSFEESLLITHRGLSGPSILQISSYLESFANQSITINFMPGVNLKKLFLSEKNTKKSPLSYLRTHLTNRLASKLTEHDLRYQKSLCDLSHDDLYELADAIQKFVMPIADSEGYLKAEVTIGGVDTQELSSKTMESKKVPRLFFVGEVVDVTGWLGGYNFQWAWSSGFTAGSYC